MWWGAGRGFKVAAGGPRWPQATAARVGPTASPNRRARPLPPPGSLLPPSPHDAKGIIVHGCHGGMGQAVVALAASLA